MPKNGQFHQIELEQDKLEFLEDIVKRHGLRDIGKAIRCLVNYAREHPERQADIFEEIRCLDC